MLPTYTWLVHTSFTSVTPWQIGGVFTLVINTALQRGHVHSSFYPHRARGVSFVLLQQNNHFIFSYVGLTKVYLNLAVAVLMCLCILRVKCSHIFGQPCHWLPCSSRLDNSFYTYTCLLKAEPGFSTLTASPGHCHCL